MKPCTLLLTVLVLAGGSFAARAALQEGMPAPVKPGPEHEVLKHMAGTWDAVIESQSSPTPEKGTMTHTLGMGGLWVVGDFKGSMMGGSFLGHEVLGWDPEKKKYVSCWVDSMSAALTLSEGAWDEAKKTMTMTSLTADPMSGQKMVNVTKVQDADHHVFTMHPGSADAPAMMTITYTRKK